MKCNHCQQELEEGVTLCPNCGTENAQASETPVVSETPNTTKLSPGKLALAIAACVALLALLIALIVGGLSVTDVTGETQDTTGETSATDATGETVVATTPPDGNPEDVTAKGTYTPADITVVENMDVVVATMGDKQLTNSDLQIYYGSIVNQFVSSQDFTYLYYYGIVDFSQPLDTLLCYYDESMTWQQYFLSEALSAWQCYQALANEAAAVGHELSAEYREYLDTLPQALEEDAANGGYASVQEMIELNLGAGATLEGYLTFQETYYLGYSYYQSLGEAIQPTDAEIEAYFAENETFFAENGITKDTKTVDVRHILIQPEGGTTDADGNTTYSDTEWADCLAEAQRIRDEWLAGDKTEDSFAALANQYSEDPGSNTNGGLYTDISESTNFVTNFKNWCLDTTRKAGDYGIVQSEHGYHIMFYAGENYPWSAYAESFLINDTLDAQVKDAIAKYPLEADYAAMVIYFTLT